MLKNISSYTAKGETYPEFISITEHEEGVSLNVRAPVTAANGIPKEGALIEIVMNENDFKEFIDEAQKNFKPSLDPNQLDMDV